MRYYLDFERTSFDTDGLESYLNERPDASSRSFEPGELSRFLYPDAAQFLRDKENAVTIITSGDRSLQEQKAKSALYGIPRTSVMYTSGLSKGEFLAPHTHLHKDAILVDDSPEELEIVAAGCPELVLYEIRRDGGAGDGRWPVIRSLQELP